jgi:microtubule-associated protein 1
MAGKKLSPIYMDLAYVPHHGNSYYTHVEFFKKIRARYYVFSGTEPSKEAYNALLEAKQTWEDKNLGKHFKHYLLFAINLIQKCLFVEVTIIPTYDTDVLGYWVSENEELLAKYHIDLSPSAARCTINLQDHETSCSAYRLEF